MTPGPAMGCDVGPCLTVACGLWGLPTMGWWNCDAGDPERDGRWGNGCWTAGGVAALGMGTTPDWPVSEGRCAECTEGTGEPCDFCGLWLWSRCAGVEVCW